MPATQTTQKAQAGMQDINQQFKERDVQAKASLLKIPYVNLINFPLNPDLAQVITREESETVHTVPFFKSGKKLRLAVVDPELPEAKAFIEKMKEQGHDVSISLCSEESLKSGQAIYFTDQYQKRHAPVENIVEEQDLGSFAAEVQNLNQLKDKIEQSNYDEALNYVQVGGYRTHASDIHFQPEEKDVLVRFRIDGVLTPVFNLSRKIYEGILKQIKHLSRLKMNIVNMPQDGQYSFNINKRQINVRVSILPSHYGETCVMRLLDAQKTFAGFDQLGYDGEALRNIKEAVQLPHGMVLVTGPTGSGKTTTMYSMLQTVDTKAKKVITLEDPIEYNLQGITQSQVNPDVGYDFSSGLRAILRQDPDVIMVGEIRDFETAETAAQASLTGHLVISTLHTNSAIESIPRLVNMGVKSFILAPALDLIVAQRLVRKLCPYCAKENPISEIERQHIAQILDSIKAKGLEIPAIPEILKTPVGCNKCGKTGFLGQIAIAEVLRFNQELRDLILKNAAMPDIYDYISKHCKMLNLHEDGILKVVRGTTTLDEVYRVAA